MYGTTIHRMAEKSSFTIIIYFTINILFAKTARILVFIPTASISHQIVFRPFTQELAIRGHEVVVITTDPAFSEENAPANLKEIDVSDVAYDAKNLGFAAAAKGNSDDVYEQIASYSKILFTIFEAEIKSDKVQAIMKYPKKYFDLLILEACVRPALIFSHIFEAPVILFSTLGTYDAINEYSGTAMHPLLYPTMVHQRINNLTMWEKLQELYKHYLFAKLIGGKVTDIGDEMLRRNFGTHIPSLKKLSKNVDMVFLAQHHIWDNNRPVPPSVIYLGGIYPTDSTKELPSELKTYLDSSLHGVIYMGFGTNVNTSLLPQHAVKTFVKVFSQLPYDILLKWDTDKLDEVPENVKLIKWVPQSDLLRHPKIKLFITQGGLQSTSDAINAGVCIIGMPMLADQWYNVEQSVRLKIGIRLDIDSVTEETMLAAIKTATRDDSCRNNVVALRSLLRDQPQTALDRAVWWAEHVIRHKGARHLRAPTALISYWEYYEVDLVLTIAGCLLLTFTVLTIVLYKAMLFCLGNSKTSKCKNE